MRIVLLADYYEAYIRDFHAAHASQLAGLTYSQHMEFLLRDYFGSFGSYRNHFRGIGHDAELIVANYHPLQQKWLSEHGVKLVSSPETTKQVMLRQLEEIKPEAFFMGSMFHYYGEFLTAVARITPNIITWISCPIPGGLDYSHVKCIVTSHAEYPKLFNSLGVKSEFLLAAFDPEILAALQNRPRSVPVSFVGSISANHQTRLETLEWLIKQGVPLEIWGLLGFGRKEKVKRHFGERLIEKRHHGAVWGLAMYQALADSKLTLNIHIDLPKTGNFGGNMRTFEATGCGALLITDRLPENGSGFDPGAALVQYTTREDLAERINYYLNHEKEAADLAARGQAICLQNHSYTQRIRDFEAILLRHCN